MTPASPAAAQPFCQDTLCSAPEQGLDEQHEVQSQGGLGRSFLQVIPWLLAFLRPQTHPELHES